MAQECSPDEGMYHRSKDYAQQAKYRALKKLTIKKLKDKFGEFRSTSSLCTIAQQRHLH